MNWTTSRRSIDLGRPLVMGILNVTPDSFSDGGRFVAVSGACQQAENMAAEGADIIDIGGESTRPGSDAVPVDEEIRRVVPVIRALTDRIEIPISIDTWKGKVAQAAVDAGAEIINDISGLRWDAQLADVAAATGAGLILMHSRGQFETMHSQKPVDDILNEVASGLKNSIEIAKSHGVRDDQIAVDIGIGFGKMPAQNLELLAKLGNIIKELKPYPMLAGASRKSFIGKLLGDLPAEQRLGGSLAAAIAAIICGASIVRVHDVRETVAALRTYRAIIAAGSRSEV